MPHSKRKFDVPPDSGSAAKPSHAEQTEPALNFIKRHEKPKPSKLSATVSFVIHGGLILTVALLAKNSTEVERIYRQITASIEKKPPQPEKVPEKPPPVQAKVPLPVVETQPQKQEQAAPPRSIPDQVVPAMAPAAVNLAAFSFPDGAKEVASLDPISAYKQSIQTAFRNAWARPIDLNDQSYVAVAVVTIDRSGKITSRSLSSKTGDAHWDNSVLKALNAVSGFIRPPPIDFPNSFEVRFDTVDVESLAAL